MALHLRLCQQCLRQPNKPRKVVRARNDDSPERDIISVLTKLKSSVILFLQRLDGLLYTTGNAHHLHPYQSLL
jgi:hypothetical protein